MKKINKFTLLLTVCLISVALVLVLVACDEPDGDEHTHVWSDWSIGMAPTQDAPGSVTRTCSADGCSYGGGVQSVEIPALSSDSYTAGADTATCGVAGTKTYTVTIPGYDAFTFSVVSPAKGNHNLTPVGAVSATCTAQGAEAYWECGTCHKKFSDENGANEIDEPVATEINPNNHALTTHTAVEAKCNADGNIAYWTCNDCHKFFSDAQGTNVITEAETVVHKETVAHQLSHVPATANCTTNGYEEYWSCGVCHNLYSDSQGTNKIDAPVSVQAHHNYGQWSIEIPTTSSTGIARRTCSVCAVGSDGHEDTVTLPMLDSDEYVKGANTATCEVAGTQEYNLTPAGKPVISFTVATPAKGHDSTLTKKDAVASTCTVQGTAQYWECSCGQKFSDAAGTTKIDEPAKQALANHTGQWVSQVNQTCTTAGVRSHYTCTKCGKNFKEYNCKTEYTEAELILEASHSITTVYERSATCTSDGCIKHYKCTRTGTGSCGGKLFSDQAGTQEIVDKESVVRKKTGHSKTPTHTVRVEPTCETAGNIEYWTCGQCNKKFTTEDCSGSEVTKVTIVKTNHKYGAYVVTAPTADGTGMAVKTCTNTWCDTAGGHQVSRTLPVLGDPQYTITNSTATCTEDGEADYAITVVDPITFHTTALKGHLWKAGVIAGTNNKSNVVKTCGRCSETEGETYVVDEVSDLTSGDEKFIDRKDYLIKAGDNKSAKLSFVLDNEGTFCLSFVNMTKVTVKLSGVEINGATAYSMNRGLNSTYEGKLAVECEDNVKTNNVLSVTFTVDSEMVGKNVVLNMSFANTDAAFVVQTQSPDEPERTLEYGDNIVVTQLEGSTVVYTYVPALSGKVSLTVPAGVSVYASATDMAAIIDNIDGTGSAYANIEVTEGEAKTFFFLGTSIKGVTVTIGEEVSLPTIGIGTPIDIAVNHKGDVQNGAPMTSIAVGNGVAEGKYTLAIKGAPSLAQGRAYFVFAKNNTYDADALWGANGNNGKADVYFQVPMPSVLDSNDVSSTTFDRRTATWTIVLNLKAGDVLTFLGQFDGSFSLTLTLTAA